MYKFNPFTGNFDISGGVSGLTTSIIINQSGTDYQYNFVNGVLTSITDISYFIVDEANNFIVDEAGDFLVYQV